VTEGRETTLGKGGCNSWGRTSRFQTQEIYKHLGGVDGETVKSETKKKYIEGGGSLRKPFFKSYQNQKLRDGGETRLENEREVQGAKDPLSCRDSREREKKKKRCLKGHQNVAKIGIRKIRDDQMRPSRIQ